VRTDNFARPLPIADAVYPKFKVLWAIVVPHPVLMMDGLFWSEGATQDMGHDDAVFERPRAAQETDVDVSLRRFPPVPLSSEALARASVPPLSLAGGTKTSVIGFNRAGLAPLTRQSFILHTTAHARIIHQDRLVCKSDSVPRNEGPPCRM